MKVFEFDPATGRRGAQIGDIQVPSALGNPGMAKCTLPRAARDTRWSVATEAFDRNNERIEFDRPVCFCMGQWTAGEETTWHWYALLPQDDGVSADFLASQEELYAEGFRAF